MFRHLLFAGCLALLAFATPAGAQTPTDLVNKGDYAGARALLGREIKGRPDAALHAAFLEAVILEHKGDFVAAASLYRQILGLDPKFEPARRALAIVLARMGDQRGALFQAETLATTTTDDRLRAELRQAIAVMGGTRRSGVSTRLAFLPSTNLNHATAADTVLIGGLPFVLDPSSRQASGIGLSFGATAWHNWLLSENWLATGSLSFDQKVYSTDVVPNETVLGARLDFSGNYGRGAVSFGPRISRTWLGGVPYLDQIGFGVTANYAITPNLVATLDTSLTRQIFRTQEFRTGYLATVTPGLVYALAPGWTLGVGIPLAVERTQLAFLNHNDAGLQLSLGHAVKGGLHVGISLGYGIADYAGIYPGTSLTRHDKTLTAGIVLSDDRIRLGQFVPELSFRHTVVDSNIGIQSYQSNDFGLTFVRRF